MNYDAIIIGFGKGGKTLAGYLAKKGKKVALIERSNKMYGGTCINVGCIPSKSLVNSSSLSGQLDVDFNSKKELYRKAIEEKRRVTSFLREKNYQKLATLENVTIYDGFASFVSENEVKIVFKDKPDLVIKGEKIFINTGSSSFIPPIKGIKDNPHVFFSSTLMDNEVLPSHLAIVGGGYISMEFASMYLSFGSAVTIIQDTEDFLPREDRDIAEAIYLSLTKRGVNVIRSAKVLELTAEGNVSYLGKDGVEKKVDSDAVLVATGRRANVEGLALEKANVELSERKTIKVNEYLETSNPNIYALGDVNGGLQFTYISLDDYRIVKDRLEGKKDGYSLLKRKNVPYSVFMTPALSRVGLTEAEAISKGYKIKVGKMPAGGVPKAQVLKVTDGVLKIVVDEESHKILGASIFCVESYEMINIIKLAMDLGAPYEVLRDNIYTHPTISEALNDLLSLL